ncbi:hypothetical protein ACE6H2_016332 [Prunus campanulata]
MAAGLFSATNPNPIRLIQSSYLTCKAPNLTPFLLSKSKQKHQHIDDWISEHRGPRIATLRFKNISYLLIPHSELKMDLLGFEEPLGSLHLERFMYKKVWAFWVSSSIKNPYLIMIT